MLLVGLAQLPSLLRGRMYCEPGSIRLRQLPARLRRMSASVVSPSFWAAWATAASSIAYSSVSAAPMPDTS